MILSLDSILNVRLVGDNLATLCGEKERQRSDAVLFLPFFPKKNFFGPTGFDPQSKTPVD